MRTQMQFEEWKKKFFPRISQATEYDIEIPHQYADYLWEKADVNFTLYKDKIWSVVRQDLPTDSGEFDRPLYTQLIAGAHANAIHYMVTTLYAQRDVFVILN